ncbi:MAG TPA: hypothetical protein VE913_12940 [Longimicrobium sp.]|nr:hypothetical protein [Longimicrobium sp.]
MHDGSISAGSTPFHSATAGSLEPTYTIPSRSRYPPTSTASPGGTQRDPGRTAASFRLARAGGLCHVGPAGAGTGGYVVLRVSAMDVSRANARATGTGGMALGAGAAGAGSG